MSLLDYGYVPCPHASRTSVWKIASDGTRRYYMQCDRCGAAGNQIPKADPRVATAIPWRDIKNPQIALLEQARRAKQAAWRARYETHMASPAWAALRRKVIEREGGLCQGCRERRGAHVHHMTYQRLGHELLTDLVLYCDTCHAHAHADREAAPWW